MTIINEKLRGGYYTPEPVAKFIANWAIRDKNDTILEPSCGDGVFLKCAKEVLLKNECSEEDLKKKIEGVELYKEEATKARKNGVTVINSDFFEHYKKKIKQKKEYNVVLGNPPFIRYQNFEEKYRKIAFDLTNDIGINLNRLTNIWVPFLVLATECLESNGRIGMVLPAELFQVDYAAKTRKYLSEQYEHIIIITFKKLFFHGIQEEVIILLGEKKSKKKGIEVIELERVEDLETVNLKTDTNETKVLNHDSDKWTKYYLSNKELELLEKVEKEGNLYNFCDLMEVNVGVVSGQNKFFVIDESTVQQYGIEESVIPIIGRSEQLLGLKLTNSDYKRLIEKNKKVFLFLPEDMDFEELGKGERKYIKVGEDCEYHTGFKCRNRKRWYIVPISWMPDAFMLRQINRTPRIVLNKTNATCTDTLHKIKFKEGVKGKEVVAAFNNSFTFAQCEITGRSYGGGVMTFEPNEVRSLKIPMKGASELDVKVVDKLVRKNNYEEVLDYCDNILLKKHMGLSNAEINTLRTAWRRLSSRRLERKKGL